MNIFKITACATLLMIANESVSIEKQSYEDNFAKLAHQISDKRFVAIGEQSHGAGNVFDFKAQFIQYMHQKHNFDVFVIESGLFDVDMLYRNFLSSGDSIEQNSPDNIFYMYANSSEISPFIFSSLSLAEYAKLISCSSWSSSNPRLNSLPSSSVIMSSMTDRVVSS